jgi:hypothetical protein
MVVADLTERSEGRGSVSVPSSAPVVRTLTDARPELPTAPAVRAAARAMPTGLPGGAVLMTGSGNDPERGRPAMTRLAYGRTERAPQPARLQRGQDRGGEEFREPGV